MACSPAAAVERKGIAEVAEVSTGDVVASSAPSLAGRRRIATLFTWGLILVLVFVSASVLARFGIPYAAPGGSMLTKIHPATWLSVPVVLVWAWANGGIGRFVARLAVARPGLVVFAAAITLLFFHAAAVVKQPVAPVVDTFVLPLFLFFALLELDERDLRRLETLLHVVMAANALVGLAEYATGWRLTPLYEADGRLMSYEWRASALFGHPLVNAFVTGNYLVVLAFGGSPRLPMLLRIGLLGLCALSMVAFGGRAALVVAVAMVALAFALGALRIVRGGRFRLEGAVTAILAATAVVVLLVVFVEAGGADRFIDRFTNDYGSAQTRVSMLRIFDALTPEQFLLWPDGDLIAQAQREQDIRIGVESSEVGFVANYGLLVTLVFFAALAAFLRELVLATSPKSLAPIVYFSVVMSTSLGIAAKTTLLAVFVLFIFAMFPKTPPPDRSA